MERYSFLEESRFFVKKEVYDMGVLGFRWIYRDSEGDKYMIFLPNEMRLDWEEELRKSHPELSIRVMWMQKPLREAEVLVVEDYLGKYVLYKEIK